MIFPSTEIALRTGSLNRDQERFGNIQMGHGAERRTYALCHSYKCTKTKTGIEKKTRRAADTCPDCGHALLWKTEYV